MEYIMKALALFLFIFFTASACASIPIFETGSLEATMEQENCKRVAVLDTGNGKASVEAWKCPLMYYIPVGVDYVATIERVPKPRYCIDIKITEVFHYGIKEKIYVVTRHCGHEDIPFGFLLVPYPKFGHFNDNHYFDDVFADRFQGYYN